MNINTIIAICLLSLPLTPALADDERPITLTELPQNSQQFLQKHFSHLTFAYAVAKAKSHGIEYEVKYTDRTEIEFRPDGSWKSVECKYKPVPEDLIPTQIRTFLDNSRYKGSIVNEIKRKTYGWEIELSSGWELTFNAQYQLIDVDD